MNNKDDLAPFVKMLEGRSKLLVKEDKVIIREDVLSPYTPIERVFGGVIPHFEYHKLKCPTCGVEDLLFLELFMYRNELTANLDLKFKESYPLFRYYVHCKNRDCESDSRTNENLRSLAFHLRGDSLKKISKEELFEVESRRICFGESDYPAHLEIGSPEEHNLGGKSGAPVPLIQCPFCHASSFDIHEERLVKYSIDQNLKTIEIGDLYMDRMYIECQKCFRTSKDFRALRAIALHLYYEIYVFGGRNGLSDCSR